MINKNKLLSITKKIANDSIKTGRKKGIKLLSFPYIIWMIGFIVLPLILILYYGLTNKSGELTFSNIALVSSPVNRKALLLALELSLISTIICLLLAYPLSMIDRKSVV